MRCATRLLIARSTSAFNRVHAGFTFRSATRDQAYQGVNAGASGSAFIASRRNQLLQMRAAEASRAAMGSGLALDCTSARPLSSDTEARLGYGALAGEARSS